MLIALDTNVFIAALSPREANSGQAHQLMRSVASGEHQATASALVYGEILALGARSLDIADISGFFDSLKNLRTVAADDVVCQRAGQLRRQFAGLRLPDALHLASALQVGAEVFITDDKQLVAIAKRVMHAHTLDTWQA